MVCYAGARRGGDRGEPHQHGADIDGFVEAADADSQPVPDAVELLGLGRPT